MQCGLPVVIFPADGLTAEVVDGASLCMSLRSFVEPFGSFGEHGFLGLPCSSEQDFCKLPLQPLYLRRGVPVHRSYDTQNPVAYCQSTLKPMLKLQTRGLIMLLAEGPDKKHVNQRCPAGDKESDYCCFYY